MNVDTQVWYKHVVIGTLKLSGGQISKACITGELLVVFKVYTCVNLPSWWKSTVMPCC